jgi:hypothetical protein
LSDVQSRHLAATFRQNPSLKPDILIFGDVFVSGMDMAELLNVPWIKFAPGHLFEPMDQALNLYKHETSYVPSFGFGLPNRGMPFHQVSLFQF